MENIKKFNVIIFILTMIFFIFGCETGGGATGRCSSNSSTNADPAAAGSFTKCTYTANLANSNYASAIVYYPCSGNGPFAATTLTGGYSNTKENMDWLGSHLVTHGFLVIAMTPNNTFGDNSQWTQAHKAGVFMLKSENCRFGSPINGKVNTNALQIMGFSKGGGGALLASSEMGSQIKATQALAPYMDGTYNLGGIKSATICYTAVGDAIAAPSNVVAMFDGLPAGIDRTLANFKGINHFDWFTANGHYKDRMKTYITSWMKVYLNNDVSYINHINGLQSGWFHEFEKKTVSSR